VTASRNRLVERRDLVRRDLEELEGQLEEGEVDAAAAERLRAAYQAELDSLETAIADLPERGRDPQPKAEPDPQPVGAPAAVATRSPRRMVVGSLLVIAALSAAIAFLARDTTPRDTPEAASGSPGALTVDPATVSNEELEAVVAANPNINPMRMALADRYYDAEEYGSALDHYFYIVENNPTPAEESKIYARIGWMAYITGQAEAAADYVEQSLAIEPTNAEAILFRGFVTMYGLGDPEAAIPQLELALRLPNISDNVVSQIEDALAEARQGGSP
jgi:tetratricopeptide (TPR) repeat protein